MNRRATQKRDDKQRGCFGNLCVLITVLAITLVQRWVVRLLPDTEQTRENYLGKKGLRGLNF